MRLSEANLCQASLSEVALRYAQLSGANLFKAQLGGANLFEAQLGGANLRGASLSQAYLYEANFYGADLSGANLSEADLRWANLPDAQLGGANLRGANLSGAILFKANLSGANLEGAILIQTDLRNADLTGCRVYGLSAWDLKLEGAKQRDLVITAADQRITVENIEVAQFIYLLIYNKKIRDIIDTITSKVVLILGRFTPERKAVLDALGEELGKYNYIPVLFDFDKPISKDLTGTVSTLANMARFIIADLTDPSCIPYELATVLSNTFVPVQPILLSGKTRLLQWSVVSY